MYRQRCIGELTTADVAEDELWHPLLPHVRPSSSPWDVIRVWIFIKVFKVDAILALGRNFVLSMAVSDGSRWWFLGTFASTLMHTNTIRSKASLTVVARYQVSLGCLPLGFLYLLSVQSIHTLTYTVSQKNCAKLFLPEIRQISTNFDNFWQKDGKEAKIMRGALIFHLT